MRRWRYGAVLVPQAMADATLAAAPPVSRALRRLRRITDLRAASGPAGQLSVGPSSGVAILFRGDGRADRGREPDRFLNLTTLLALMTGGLLALAGVARLGFIAQIPRQAGAGRLHGRSGARDPGGQISSLLGIPAARATSSRSVGT